MEENEGTIFDITSLTGPYAPDEYKCDKCGYTTICSPFMNRNDILMDEHGRPICPQCMVKFISENVPSMTRIDRSDTV